MQQNKKTAEEFFHDEISRDDIKRGIVYAMQQVTSLSEATQSSPAEAVTTLYFAYKMCDEIR